jgi:hypothetical protein
MEVCGERGGAEGPSDKISRFKKESQHVVFTKSDKMYITQTRVGHQGQNILVPCHMPLLRVSFSLEPISNFQIIVIKYCEKSSVETEYMSIHTVHSVCVQEQNIKEQRFAVYSTLE